jgi:hypothetical protein
MSRRGLSRLLVSASLMALGAPALASDDASAPNVARIDRYQIMIRADRRALDRVLAVHQEAVAASDETIFAAYSNYRTFIDHAEIRIFLNGEQGRDSRLLATIPLDESGRARVRIPTDVPDGASYVLRAYGHSGAWDETRAHPLLRSGLVPGANAQFGQADETTSHSIAVAGVMLSVQGRADPARHKVLVNGMQAPVDRSGLFVWQQIVSASKGTAHVEISEGEAPVLVADRHYNANDNRWFVVGQGDITFSHSVATGPAVAVTGDPLAQGDHVLSRGAFYAKGVLGRDYRVTASVDTGEVLFKDLLSNLDRKDPSQLLRRLDDRDHYPTFGDDSAIVEDAPTQGRFYMRVQHNDSNLVVGNFITASQGTELIQLDRGVFGAMIDYKSQKLTSYGDRKRQVFAFASDPGTITTSDELRGTGGSLYYLNHKDLSVGSERLRLEVRSPQTGAILSSSQLRINEDYEIDYFQGRVTLLRPLASYLANGELVRAGSGAGNVPVLVARYEYTPAEGTITGHSLGARATQWVGNWLRLGLTGQSESDAPANQLALGGDVTIKAGANTWLKGEMGRTDGPGFTQNASLNGGLNFAQVASSAQAGQLADAFRIEGALDEADLSARLRGTASGYYEEYDAGFAAMGRISATSMRRWGTKLDQQIGLSSRLALAYEGRSDQGTGATKLARAEWTRAIASAWSLRGGLRYEDTTLPTGSLQAQGKRLDGGLQATYAPLGSAWSTYGFGQATLGHDLTRHRNNRGGIGIKWDISRTFSAQGEVSDGTGGWAATASLLRHGRNGSESRIGYRLYSDVSDRGYDPQDLMTQSSRGMLVVGNQQRIGSTLTLTGEEKYGHGGAAPSLAHSYGLRFTPDRAWSLEGGVEKSTIFAGYQRDQGGIDRLALTFAAGYSTAPLIATSAVEYRHDAQGGMSQTSWLFKDKLEFRPDDSWRILGRLEYAFTDVSGASLQAADYTRAIAGLAYRPVSHDRLNLIARYTYFRDLGPAGQIMANGGVEQPKQVSQVISFDLNYDLTGWLTLGGKYAWRQGRVSIARASDTFVNSAASLCVARVDVRISPNWEGLLEGRYMTASSGGDSRAGTLIAIYRHLGGGIKLGTGYNFADYSTDLTDQSYSTKGFFVNLLAAF